MFTVMFSYVLAKNFPIAMLSRTMNNYTKDILEYVSIDPNLLVRLFLTSTMTNTKRFEQEMPFDILSEANAQ